MIINLTGRLATPAEMAAGVFDLRREQLAELRKLLSANDIGRRNAGIVCLAADAHAALTGGDPDPMGGTCRGAEVLIDGATDHVDELVAELTAWGFVVRVVGPSWVCPDCGGRGGATGASWEGTDGYVGPCHQAW